MNLARCDSVRDTSGGDSLSESSLAKESKHGYRVGRRGLEWCVEFVISFLI